MLIDTDDLYVCIETHSTGPELVAYCLGDDCDSEDVLSPVPLATALERGAKDAWCCGGPPTLAAYIQVLEAAAASARALQAKRHGWLVSTDVVPRDFAMFGPLAI